VDHASRPFAEERRQVWESLSDLWIETSDLGDDDLAACAAKLAVSRFSIGELEYIAKHEFCGGMAFVSLGVGLTAGGALPLFAYPEGEVYGRVARHLARPVVARLNPFWWLGYFLARTCLLRFWARLRAKIEVLRASRDRH
jgi:hypothetical protein